MHFIDLSKNIYGPSRMVPLYPSFKNSTNENICVLSCCMFWNQITLFLLISVLENHVGCWTGVLQFLQKVKKCVDWLRTFKQVICFSFISILIGEIFRWNVRPQTSKHVFLTKVSEEVKWPIYGIGVCKSRWDELTYPRKLDK